MSSSSTDGETTVVDTLPDGSVESTIQANPPQGEQAGLEACRVLVRRLNQHGANWSDPVPVTQTASDVDHEARDGMAVLRVQVTKADLDQRIWRDLASAGKVDRTHRAEEMVDSLRAAIWGKARKIPPVQRATLILALDARLTPGYVFASVANAFRARHGDWARGLGFAGIWVVGQTPELTRRLDS